MIAVALSSTAGRTPFDWEFGGYPYGLMPLILPKPGLRWLDGDLTEVLRQSAKLSADAGAPPAPDPHSIDQLLWFRWITGNQASSTFWQLLDDELALVLSDGLPTAARNAAALLDGYSALLVYAGVPTREAYARLIRPAMALQHRSFSGRWAVDYVPVMAKLLALRGAYRGRMAPEDIARVIEASRVNHRVHVAVAAKLVPSDGSLLRANDGLTLSKSTPENVALYDAFYSTAREVTSRERVVTQLLLRVRAILQDLRVNGLYPAGSDSAHERPAGLWDSKVAGIEARISDVLEAAAHAAVAALRQPITA
ncbi:hypothetical protein [Actinoplanes siamensis]|uniref:Uncharacterized protein n=1 Tax=Actinoplanes siamensis TaxID=1223317 RepID=A0A919NEZ4_9ACTN|nr:hypothetical protein [Actinoplanes siamensis]GIF09345.1 hypothetical protein Asi03nite_68830 [Actinoplanes siamensis]